MDILEEDEKPTWQVGVWCSEWERRMEMGGGDEDWNGSHTRRKLIRGRVLSNPVHSANCGVVEPAIFNLWMGTSKAGVDTYESDTVAGDVSGKIIAEKLSIRPPRLVPIGRCVALGATHTNCH